MQSLKPFKTNITDEPHLQICLSGRRIMMVSLTGSPIACGDTTLQNTRKITTYFFHGSVHSVKISRINMQLSFFAECHICGSTVSYSDSELIYRINIHTYHLTLCWAQLSNLVLLPLWHNGIHGKITILHQFSDITPPYNLRLRQRYEPEDENN